MSPRSSAIVSRQVMNDKEAATIAQPSIATGAANSNFTEDLLPVLKPYLDCFAKCREICAGSESQENKDQLCLDVLREFYSKWNTDADEEQ